VNTTTTHYPVVRAVRVPIPLRLRFAAEALTAMQKVPKDAPRMRARRCFRLAMERQRMRTMRRWVGETVR